jgi:hypothetical protein
LFSETGTWWAAPLAFTFCRNSITIMWRKKVSVQGDKGAVPQPLLAVGCCRRTRGPFPRQDPQYLSTYALAWRANWKPLTASSSSAKSKSKAMNKLGRSIS